MVSNTSVSQLLPAFTTVFFILAVGFGIQRLHPFTEDALRQLTQLVVDILLPVLLFYVTAASTTPAILKSTPILVISGVLIPLISLLFAVIIGKITNVNQENLISFRFSAMVGNTSFLGIPICASLFGATGAVYAVLYDFGTTLVIWTAGIWILNGGTHTKWKALVGNPFILAVVAGLAWAWTGLKLPEWFARPISTLGNVTIPLALLLVGAQLGNIRSSMWRQWQLIAWLTTIRLILTPMVIVAVMGFISLPDASLSRVIVVESAMPVGLITAIMTRNSGLDADLPATAILWSTMALLITLPVLVILLI
jgi:malate permease and related proteins